MGLFRQTKPEVTVVASLVADRGVEDSRERELMNREPLWYRLIADWKAARMGVTGPTLPFLIGAAHLVDGREGDADISELSSLLFSLQRAKPHNVRIAPCGTPKKPVATLCEAGTMEARELIKLNKGKSSLYLSRDYPHEQDIDSACAALWDAIGEVAITPRLYSFNQGRYGPYTQKELAFIKLVADRLTTEHR